jgi:undecaprenyl-phosphate galactose phosphotransferase
MQKLDFLLSSSDAQNIRLFPAQHIPYKRIFDILFSLCALTLGLPVYLLIALCVWLSSPGPIFYAHERIGRGGKTIRCYKFRTMHQNADEILQNLLKNNPEYSREWNQFFKLKNDPRITSIGNFLRRTSLDELPQFYNVLKGDLSVVGPRPVVAEEVNKYYKERAAKILSVRPGLTGIWQTSGRNSISMEKRVDLEESYIDNHSFLKDLVLICKTLPVMLFSKGAY